MTRLEAEITLDYAESKVAKAVADAVSPDNWKTPAGLMVKTQRRKNTVLTTVVCEGKLGTFVATIDDLLSAVGVAERTLQAAARKRQHKGSIQ